MAPEYLTQEQVSGLLDPTFLCDLCERELRPVDRIEPRYQPNAAVIEPQGVVHAGDVVTGQLACGANGDRWRWLVAGRPRALNG